MYGTTINIEKKVEVSLRVFLHTDYIFTFTFFTSVLPNYSCAPFLTMSLYNALD